MMIGKQGKILLFVIFIGIYDNGTILPVIKRSKNKYK